MRNNCVKHIFYVSTNLQNFDHEIRAFWSPTLQSQSDGEGNDQEECIDANLVVGNNNVTFIENGGSQSKYPKGHHKKC